MPTTEEYKKKIQRLQRRGLTNLPFYCCIHYLNLSPQTILLWEKDHIDYCLKNGKFIEGMMLKYRHAMEEGFPNFNITTSYIT